MFCNKLLHTPAPHEVLLNTTHFHLSLHPFCTQGRKPTEGGNWQSSSQTVKHEIWIIINRRTIEAHSFVQPTTRISSLQPRGCGDIYHSNHRPLNRSPEKLWASNKGRWKATFHFASLPWNCTDNCAGEVSLFSWNGRHALAVAAAVGEWQTCSTWRKGKERRRRRPCRVSSSLSGWAGAGPSTR